MFVEKFIEKPRHIEVQILGESPELCKGRKSGKVTEALARAWPGPVSPST